MLAVALATLTVVEVSAYALDAEERSALEAACSRAIGGTCWAGPPPLAAEPDCIAFVSVESEGRVVHIALERRKDAAGQWYRRTLVFAPEDVPVERWRAVGLTIATLAGPPAEPLPAPRPPAASRDAVPSAALPPAAVTEPREGASPPASFHIGLGFMAGPALEQGPWRVGGFARGAAGLEGSMVEPTIGAAASLRDRASDGLRAAWMAWSAGLSFTGSIPALDVGLRARVEALLERIVVSHDPPHDTGSMWRGGAQLGTEVTWPARRPVGLVVGVDYWWLTNGAVLVVGEERVGRAPAQAISAALGLEIRLR